jgi:hypothetical protein
VYAPLPGFDNFLVSYVTAGGGLRYEICPLNDEKGSGRRCQAFGTQTDIWDRLYDLYEAYEILSLFPIGPLKFLHDEDSISRASQDYWRKKSTAEIMEDLQKNPISVRPDGTILNGNHRLRVLQERGIDIDSLDIPKQIVPKITFPDP